MKNRRERTERCHSQAIRGQSGEGRETHRHENCSTQFVPASPKRVSHMKSLDVNENHAPNGVLNPRPFS